MLNKQQLCPLNWPLYSTNYKHGVIKRVIMASVALSTQAKGNVFYTAVGTSYKQLLISKKSEKREH